MCALYPTVYIDSTSSSSSLKKSSESEKYIFCFASITMCIEFDLVSYDWGGSARPRPLRGAALYGHKGGSMLAQCSSFAIIAPVSIFSPHEPLASLSTLFRDTCAV